MTHHYVTTARQLLGKPFRHRGRGPDYFDCVGLLSWVVQAHGGAVQDQTTYARTPHGGQLKFALEQHCGQAIQKADMREGDFILLRQRKQPMHVALVSDYPYGGFAMIHADGGMGKVVEHRIDDNWQSRIVGVYRHGA